jgi:signal transduction histidine kinase
VQTFYGFCFTMRRLSWVWRILIVFLSFALLEAPIMYLTVLGKERGVASILVFTGILAALLFPWATALALEFFLLIVYLLVNIALKGWSDLVVTSFVAGTLTDLFLVVIIGFLWYAWQLAEVSKKKEKELATLKDQFITNIYHELRTPLTNVLGSLSILRENRQSLSGEEQQMFLNEAVYAGDELQRIVDNVLDATQADSDVRSPWIRVFELDRVVLDVLDHMDALDHALHLDICQGLLVQGDSQQVEQVMRNLLSNCFKYTPKECPIMIRIWPHNAEAVVCVQDKGPGIPTDEIPKIFQKFSRLERDIAGPVRGIGLGLYICRKLIENMGGRIWVESTGVAGEGCCFFFALPTAGDAFSKRDGSRGTLGM